MSVSDGSSAESDNEGRSLVYKVTSLNRQLPCRLMIHRLMKKFVAEISGNDKIYLSTSMT